jgi:hypothetical protein
VDPLPDPDWYVDNVLAYAEPGVDDVVIGPAARWQMWWGAHWRACGADSPAVLARDQGFVVTTAQLRRFGWADHDLRRAVRRHRWSAPGYGTASPVVVPVGDDAFLAARRRHALEATAASLRRAGRTIGGRSAAILHGLPTLAVPRVPELTVPPPTTLGRHGAAHLYSATLGPNDVTTWFGAPVQTVARTVVDLARHDHRDGLIAADAALQQRLASRAQLNAALRDAAGWPGVRQARRTIAFADALAESPLESLLRLAMHRAGFPRPELQVKVYDPKYDRVYRVDMLLRRQRLIIEADGRGKYTDQELWREKRREGRLRALTGSRVERVTWADVMADWADTEHRLWLACAAS